MKVDWFWFFEGPLGWHSASFTQHSYFSFLGNISKEKRYVRLTLASTWRSRVSASASAPAPPPRHCFASWLTGCWTANRKSAAASLERSRCPGYCARPRFVLSWHPEPGPRDLPTAGAKHLARGVSARTKQHARRSTTPPRKTKQKRSKIIHSSTCRYLLKWRFKWNVQFIKDVCMKP